MEMSNWGSRNIMRKVFMKDVAEKLRKTRWKSKIITFMRIFYCNATARGSRIKMANFFWRDPAIIQIFKLFCKNIIFEVKSFIILITIIFFIFDWLIFINGNRVRVSPTGFCLIMKIVCIFWFWLLIISFGFTC